ncbi:MAG: response regulator [Syntrophobacterales bacterium]|nr:response regulator [Syntrophobacterales bacterium]
MARILLLEGEPNIRRLCREELLEEGYEVVAAGTGWEGVRLVEAFHPDVVILEARLPDTSGLEVSRMVKGTDRRVRLVLFTHCLPPRDLRAVGADAYVPKSWDLEPLKQTVRRLLS